MTLTCPLPALPALTLCATAALSSIASPASATPGVPSNGRVSWAEFYGETNDQSFTVGISADGRYVSYYSFATNIVAEDGSNRTSLYRYDRLFGITLLLSVARDGTAGSGDVGTPRHGGRLFSNDGRYALFNTQTPNMVLNDNNNQYDVFVRDTSGFGSTQRVSLTPSGQEIPQGAGACSMTADAQKIVFSTTASLVAADTNADGDFYLRDRSVVPNRTTLVSRRANGAPFGGLNYEAAIDANGTYMAVITSAALVAADTNGIADVYRIQLSNFQAVLVSASNAGVVANNFSQHVTISDDGTRVAFQSKADNLVSGDTNGEWDVFVRNMLTGAITRASTSSSGGQTGSWCLDPSLDANGRYVAMGCRFDDLVPDDVNGVWDVFVKDLSTGSMTRVSKPQSGTGPNGVYNDARPKISADGSQVSFSSQYAIVPPDTNGLTDIYVATRQ